jgi:predicted dehydrogenase
MIRVGLIGLGKMGASHLAIINSHPQMKVTAICDQTPQLPDILSRHTGVAIYSDYRAMFEKEGLDAVFVATPSRFHAEMVRAALERNLHVFCEKPFCLDPVEGAQLAELAAQKRLVNQVGYHFRFVGAFREARRLVEAGVLGKIHHVRAEAYGAVVIRPKGSTWRTSRNEGGGCLYDYACHAIDIVNFLVGSPQAVGGSVLNKIFSRDVEDEVYSTFYFPDGLTGQLAANWSDDSYRKMYTRVTLWGANGRLAVDRQEVQTFLRNDVDGVADYSKGWNLKYTTELTDEVWYYLRGEEYSAQVDHFARCIAEGRVETDSSFASAVQTDRIAALMRQDAAQPPSVSLEGLATAPSETRSRTGFFRGRRETAR